jgi:hypothetical protein
VLGNTLPPGLYIRFSILNPRQDAGSIDAAPAAPVSLGFIVEGGIIEVGIVDGFDVPAIEGVVVGAVIVPVVGVVLGVMAAGLVIAPGPVVVGATLPAAPRPGSGAALSPQAAASRKGSSVIIRRVISVASIARTAGSVAQRAPEHLGYSATS